jgi:glycosyltransferase involved in cell wall biosynthesis
MRALPIPAEPPARSAAVLPVLPAPPSIAVVLPAYRTARAITGVVARIPDLVRHVIVVDDGSPDDLQAVLAGISDPRLVVVEHAANRGLGAAMKTGFAKALELQADVVVKLDSDGQMDPALLPELIEPLLAGRADLAKGNRYTDLTYIGTIPPLRRFGNLALSFLVKVASGYWGLFDPCNGYIALRSRLIRALRPEELADRYFFEISLLCEAYLARAVVQELPMRPVYGDEVSSLSPLGSLFDFLPRLCARAARRLGTTYFLRDFNVVSVFLSTALPLLFFGGAWSAYHWYRSLATGIVATTGTVMIGTLAIILGFQLLLQAVVLDVQNEPGRRDR